MAFGKCDEDTQPRVVGPSIFSYMSILTFYYSFLEQDTDNPHIVGTTEGLYLSYV